MSSDRSRKFRRTEHHGNEFAFDVEVFVVVVVLIGGGDAEANKDYRGVDRNVGIRGVGRNNEIDVLLEWERLRLTVAGDGEGGFFHVGAKRADGNGLEVAAVVAGRLEAHAFETGGHVFCGEFVAARGGAAAFEGVVGEEAHGAADGVGGDGGHGGVGGGVVGGSRGGC